MLMVTRSWSAAEMAVQCSVKRSAIELSKLQQPPLTCRVSGDGKQNQRHELFRDLAR